MRNIFERVHLDVMLWIYVAIKDNIVLIYIYVLWYIQNGASVHTYSLCWRQIILSRCSIYMMYPAPKFYIYTLLSNT